MQAVSADGKLRASIKIPLSTDSKHRPLEVAKANQKFNFDYFSAFPDSLNPLATDDFGVGGLAASTTSGRGAHPQL